MLAVSPGPSAASLPARSMPHSSVSAWWSWSRALGGCAERSSRCSLGRSPSLVPRSVLSSVRGSAILTVAALGGMVAARAGLRPTVALFSAFLAVVVLGIGLSHVSVSAQTGPSGAANPTSGLLQHEISGITDPTGPKSTLPGHLNETISGITSAFSLPIGHGTGSVTLAAGRLGGSTSVGTEGDLGNAGTALGLPGLLLYLVIFVGGLLGTYRLAARRRDALALAAFGLLVVVALQWMNGDLYSVAWLVWLGLGWIDRSIASQASDTTLSPDRGDAVSRVHVPA